MTTIVLLPGMDGSATLFGPFIEALGSLGLAARPIAYPPDQPLGYAALGEHVRRSLTDLGKQRFVVLGESFSGPIAAMLAASPPPGLVGVVLGCSFLRNPRPTLGWLRWVQAALPLGHVPLAMLSRALLGREVTPAWRAALDNALAPVTVPVRRARLEAVVMVDAVPALAAARVPVLYLRALHDRVVPASAGRLVASTLPGVRLVDLEGPHFLLQARPMQAAQAVNDWLRQIAAPRADR